MSTSFVGVDIAKATFDAARLGADGQHKHKKFSNDAAGFAAFTAWLEGFGGERPPVCMEATGAYGIPLAGHLAAAGWPVSVANPSRVAGLAKSELARTKTDAKLIARFAHDKKPPPWTPPPPGLQALLRRAEDLLERVQMEKTAATPPAPSKPCPRRSRPSLGRCGRASASTSTKTRTCAGARVCRPPSPASARPPPPTSSPPRTATTASPAPGRPPPTPAWTSASATPARSRGSATSPSAATPCCARPCSCPALVAWHHNPALKAFCERLKAKGKNGRLVACAAMRKLLCLAFAILQSGKPFDPNYALV